MSQTGQELELHVAQIALGAELLLDLVLEQADRLGEHEVRRQLLGIERLVRHLVSVPVPNSKQRRTPYPQG
jgi:hypothetical protein